MTLGLRIDKVTHIDEPVSTFSVDIVRFKVKNSKVYIRMKVWDGDEIIFQTEKIVVKEKKGTVHVSDVNGTS